MPVCPIGLGENPRLLGPAGSGDEPRQKTDQSGRAVEARSLGEGGRGQGWRGKHRPEGGAGPRCASLAVERPVVIVVRRRSQIVVMPVGRRPRQIGQLTLVLYAVITVMPGGKVESDTECCGTRRRPPRQDGDGDQTLACGTHSLHCVSSATDGQKGSNPYRPTPFVSFVGASTWPGRLLSRKLRSRKWTASSADCSVASSMIMCPVPA